MAATNQNLVTANGKPAPQYYNADTDSYEYIQGRNGANSFIQLGTIAMEAWEGTADETRTFSGNRFGFSIVNDGANELQFTINGNTRRLLSGEAYSALFEPFTSVAVQATSPYRAEVRK